MTRNELLRAFEADRDSTVELLRKLVELESPSTDKALVDELVSFLAGQVRSCGLEPRIIPREDVGNIVWTEWGEGGGGRILVLCHVDTVWPQGSLERMPFRIEEGRIHGPGIFDMKAGVTATLKIQEFISRGWIRPNRKVRFLYTTDEETGSDASRELIEEFSRESDLVLVTEPPLPGGVLKTFRKGAGMAAMKIHGRSAHAGVEPERGVNAVRELAHQIEAIHGLASSRLETSVHVTMAEGGTRDNVIPEFAKATIDFRFRTVEEGHRVEDALHALKPRHPEIRLEVTGGINRPPMIKGEGGQQLFDQAREIGAELGLDLEEGETGGGSDGSYSAALGVPTLDGLGVDGDGAHALHEHIELEALPARAALLARLVEKL